MPENSRSNTIEGSFKALSELIAEPIVLIDNNCKILYANQVVKQVLGYGREELIGKCFLQFEFIDNESKAILRKNFEKRMEGADFEPYEIKFTTKKGKTKYLEIKGKVIDHQGKPANLAIFHDVTKRKRQQINLETKLERKNIDLMESEEKFIKVFESSPDPIAVSDLDKKIVDCNPAALSTFGHSTKNEVIGRSVFDFFAKRERVRAIENLTPKTGGVRNVEYMFVDKKGREFLGELSSSPLYQSGKIVGYVSTIKDISELKEASNKLNKLKEFDEQIIDSLGEALLIIDPENFKVINANNTAQEQLKLKKASIIGRYCYEVTYDRQSPCEFTDGVCSVREILAHGKILTREHVHVDKEKNPRYFEVSAYPVKNPEGKTVVIQIQKDITQRKKMEQELKDSEEVFHAISEYIKDALMLIDNEGKIVYWNPAAEKIFEYTKEEAVGKEFYNLVIPEDYKGLIDKIKFGVKIFAQKGKLGVFSTKSTELISKKKSGVEFPIELSVSPILLKGNWHVVSLVRDITEQKKARLMLEKYSEGLEFEVGAKSRELKETQERLLKSERLAAIGELAGMVGHDLRNPLTGIKNAAYFLKKKGVTLPEDQAKAMLEIIEKGIDHSDKIINDLLDYARETHLDLQVNSVYTMVTDSLSMVRVPEKIKVVINVPSELKIRVDQNKIERVFINIIKNSVDAMPIGGTITINTKQTNGNIEVSFADTGTGIPEETLPKLFSPLFTTKAQGMGFGLAICKRVVDAHGGTIRVETAKGKGTTFTITLPIEPKIEVGGEKIWINTSESLLLTTMKA